MVIRSLSYSEDQVVAGVLIGGLGVVGYPLCSYLLYQHCRGAWKMGYTHSMFQCIYMLAVLEVSGGGRAARKGCLFSHHVGTSDFWTACSLCLHRLQTNHACMT
jgi:hypothetical protein